MGSAGFLVSAQSYLRRHYGNELSSDRAFAQHFHTAMFHGYDMDRTLLRLGAMNMLLHGAELLRPRAGNPRQRLRPLAEQI